MRAKELVFLHCMYVHVLAHAQRGKLDLASLVQAGGVSISVLQKKKKNILEKLLRTS